MSGMIRPALLVVGATGTVGRGVVEAALAAGHAVIAVARDRPRLTALREAYPEADLTLLPMAVATDEDAAFLVHALRKHKRPLAGVVVALREDRSRGKLGEQPTATLMDALGRDLQPQLALARALLPLLAEGQGYVVVGGPGDESPWAGYGHRSVVAAALRMLARVLHEEARPRGVRVQLLSVPSPVKAAVDTPCACPEWPTARSVGEQAVALLAALPPMPASPVVRFERVQRGEWQPTGRETQRALRDARTLLRAIARGRGPP